MPSVTVWPTGPHHGLVSTCAPVCQQHPCGQLPTLRDLRWLRNLSPVLPHMSSGGLPRGQPVSSEVNVVQNIWSCFYRFGVYIPKFMREIIEDSTGGTARPKRKSPHNTYKWGKHLQRWFFFDECDNFQTVVEDFPLWWFGWFAILHAISQKESLNKRFSGFRD